jgi:hypothetical protein
MKIVFLDIDGVLNHEDFYRKRHEDKLNGFKGPEYPYSEIDTKSIINLNSLLEETGASVVISSSWRSSGLEYCKDVLEYHGFKGNIIDITPNLRSENCLRGNEILRWVKDNEELIGERYYNFTEYVILDDDSDMLYWQRNNFLLIDRYVGLTMGDVFRAKKILNGGKILNIGEL